MASIAEEIWNMKYRLLEPGGKALDKTVDDTLLRAATAAAGVEKGGRRIRERWARKFHAAMNDYGFLPGGRILAGAGSKRDVTLFNCFVMDEIPDDLGGIFDAVRDSALTMQMGGGIGLDFSTLRPKGALVCSIGADASGPVSFMDVWDAMCRTIMSAGARRGAMMATMRADHPDIETFIEAKSKPGRLTNFNLSVLVPDALMAAVAQDLDWHLVFEGKVYRTVRARDLWERIMRATYEFSEPGVIFIDRVNDLNNLGYCETIRATNPCGEQPLPPNGACLLGALNLTAFVQNPFTPQAELDLAALSQRAEIAVRFLDNIIDVSHYPHPCQKEEAFSKRRVGLGITGLADALIMCAVTYGSKRSVELAGTWMKTIQNAAYASSAGLAAEKGAFPLYDAAKFLKRPMIKRLEPETRAAIEANGLRNGCLTTIAPTGTISLLAGNVSSGIEPVFDFVYPRRVLEADGGYKTQSVEDFAYTRYKAANPGNRQLPAHFVRTADLKPIDHLNVQAAVQRYVDSSISKTVNCPQDLNFEDFKDIYQSADKLGLKGCTTYRSSPLRGAVLGSSEMTPSPAANEVATVSKVGAPAQQEQQDGAVASNAPIAQSLKQDPGAGSSMPSPTAPGNADVVYLSKPLEREPVLHGATYKLKWPGSDHALYVTINDIEREGRRRPFEIFINTKSLEHYAWTVALTRMISAVFRRGGDVTFVAQELQAIFDPQGGRWVSGRYVPSLQAAIGEIIEGHMERIGFAPAAGGGQAPDAGATGAAMLPPVSSLKSASISTNASTSASANSTSPGDPRAAEAVDLVTAAGERGRADGKSDGYNPASMLEFAQEAQLADYHRQCPRCGASGYARREGCWTCERCGYSQCD
ncbi:MAG: adenosylcobalamin-dependent ribonucleoside-diphosphate reductase [Alphaproteobacteria bacterium]|nr:adenosylcobalamin-dependent ribonucleoside-diphosphate reductase [Alphaproteobacteria bacterium]